MNIALLNHLWQSTLFALSCGLLTLPLRKNRAATRYALWFAASVKFLVPFSLLAALGAHLFRPLAPNLSAPVLFIMQPAAQPFSTATPMLQAPALTGHDWVSMLLPALWVLGSTAIAVTWLVRWMRLRAILRGATDLPLALPMPVKSSLASLEPGLVGIWRPVLLMPEGIASRLSAPEMQAVMAHELCHLRRRDNLTAALHMLVEALFWFHPLVWWLGARLIEERENACDEGVLESGSDPQVYAEGILKVCKFYLHSPLACASGISGADLKARIETIMENRLQLHLNGAKKFLLGGCAVLALAAPLAFGAMVASRALAQGVASSASEHDAILADQENLPKTIAMVPKQFDKFVGLYQDAAGDVVTFRRDGTHFYAQGTGQPPIEIFPESTKQFFAPSISPLGTWRFMVDDSEHVLRGVLYRNGQKSDYQRLSNKQAAIVTAALNAHVHDTKPSPGVAAALRGQIAALEKGVPDYDALMPPLAVSVRKNAAFVIIVFQKLGALQSLTFKQIVSGGGNVFEANFVHGGLEWTVAPLTKDGRISNMAFRPTWGAQLLPVPGKKS